MFASDRQHFFHAMLYIQCLYRICTCAVFPTGIRRGRQHLDVFVQNLDSGKQLSIPTEIVSIECLLPDK